MTPQAQTQAEPRLHRVASVMSGRRYLLLTFASTAVAVAHAARHVEDRVTAKTLLHQLMASRTSSMVTPERTLSLFHRVADKGRMYCRSPCTSTL